MTPTVLLRWLEDGSMQFAASEGVQVVCIDDRMPADRVFVTDPTDGYLTPKTLKRAIGDSAISYAGDGSEADASATAIRDSLAAGGTVH